ncbi:hypothetical protein Droror1_Dr00025554 [Drosera rotundifolia]
MQIGPTRMATSVFRPSPTKDRDNRKDNKALEVIWRGSHTFGSSSQIFANAFPVRYGPPDGFHFEVNDISDLLQDDPDFSGYNVDQRVNDFVGAAYIQLIVCLSGFFFPFKRVSSLELLIMKLLTSKLR